MKKTVLFLLTLCMLLGALVTNASAIELDNNATSGETLISLTIDRTLDNYTIVIPSTIEIDPSTKRGEAEIVVKKGAQLISCEGLHMSITDSANGVYLVNKDDPNIKQKYSIYTQGTEEEVDLEYKDGRRGLFVYHRNRNDADYVYELIFKVASLPTAGVYTDTLTFEVEPE